MGTNNSHLPPLRPYQAEAVDLVLEQGSLLLALTMGAGKTRVAIEAANRLADAGEISSTIVFCTSSLKYQWASEIEKWSNGSSCIVIDGTATKRKQLYNDSFDCDFVIMSYEMLNRDWVNVSSLNPDLIIADEVTMIKSLRAQRSKRIKQLAKTTRFRLGLTGQPVENRPEELFSIMEFVEPSVLGPFMKFDRTFIVRDHFGKPQRYRNLDTLRSKLRTAMYRKSRDDIAEFLPEINYIDLPVPLYPKAQKLYDFIADDLLSVLESSDGLSSFDLSAHYGKGAADSSNNRFKGEVMSRITAMRLLANHPDLLRASGADFDDEDTSSGSKYASYLREEGYLDKLETRSSKLDALMEYMTELSAEIPDYKLVIFCGFKPMLGFIGQELRKRGIGFTSMTGDTSSEERHRRMGLFNRNPNCRVFLSSDAGAYGINLDSGTHLINFDLPWSAGALAQRTARIDRTSSEQHSVDAIFMYCSDTVEEYQYKLLQSKQMIAKAFVDGKGFTATGSLSLEMDSLRMFLNSR